MWATVGWLMLLAAIAQPATPPKRNRLANESSPYLRLHADNPVDWYPWGAEAFAAAKRLDRPIILSIGYSSCHWCHVMNRESFANAETAKVLNANFICIKVDREERPDVDMLYMEAVRAMTSGGGWPLTVFLLPDGRPFAGGTYFPPEDRKDSDGSVAIPGFRNVLGRALAAYRDQRPGVEAFAGKVATYLKQSNRSPRAVNLSISRSTIDEALADLPKRFDAEFGGMSSAPRFAPKFPQPGVGIFVLETAKSPDDLAVAAIAKQVDAMIHGGIFDQLAGGFHRYSVDREWLVPHFEKMLYDQAQILSLLSALQSRKPSPLLQRTAKLTVEFLEREMRSPEGLFYSALDADSEHEEGKFYAWSPEELQQILGNDAAWFRKITRTDGPPNFEQKYALQLAKDFDERSNEVQWNRCRARLMAVRAKRVRPRTDDKLIAGWNGLAMVGLSNVAVAFSEPTARRLAVEAADAALRVLIDSKGQLARHAIGGKATGRGFADDHAAMVLGLLAVHRLSAGQGGAASSRFKDAAVRLGVSLRADFWDAKTGRLNFSGLGHETLLANLPDTHDGVIPSATSLAALAFVELAKVTGEKRFAQYANDVFESETANVVQHPLAATSMLLAWQQLQTFQPAAKPLIVENVEQPIAGIQISSGKIVVAPGESMSAKLDIGLTGKWHINANPASPEYLKPTVVRLQPTDGVELANVDYPKGKSLKLGGFDEAISAYENSATIGLTFRATASAKPGVRTMTLTIDYQACDDRHCLAPATREVMIEVEVRSR